MAEVTRIPFFAPLEAELTERPPRPRVASDWPLMGDILTHRAGWPEHLIRWRQAEGRESTDK